MCAERRARSVLAQAGALLIYGTTDTGQWCCCTGKSLAIVLQLCDTTDEHGILLYGGTGAQT